MKSDLSPGIPKAFIIVSSSKITYVCVFVLPFAHRRSHVCGKAFVRSEVLLLLARCFAHNSAGKPGAEIDTVHVGNSKISIKR